MNQAAEPKSISVSRNKLLVALAMAFAALLAGGLALVLIVATQRSGLQGTPSPNSPVIGTWRGERGNLLNFRPDGTARSLASPGERIGYLEWDVAADELRVYHIVSTKSAVWRSRLHHWLAGDHEPDDRYEVIEVSPTSLKLRCKMGTRQGQVTTFVPATDTVLETAP